MYGGKHMCDLFSLIFGGLEMSTIKRAGRKGIQFVPTEHRKILKVVVHIYRDAKSVHRIT